MGVWFYLGGAYILVWAFLVFYVYSIWRKQRALISRIESLERHIQNKGIGHLDSNVNDN